jgi:arsenate reductase
MPRERILFLCTGNSCRSAMAEAWCRALQYERYEAFSAGTIAKGLNPKMVQVMREVGIDPTIHQSSKTLTSVIDAGVQLDTVVTVGFDDPPHLEIGTASPEEALGHYRRVRDEIRRFIAGLPGSLS